jgi:hypothetical protein
MPKHTRTITVSWPEAVALIRKALSVPDHAEINIDGLDMPNLIFAWDEPEPKTEPALPSQTLWPQRESDYMPKFDTRCRVCRINIGAGPMGYVCTRDDCPTRARVR